MQNGCDLGLGWEKCLRIALSEPRVSVQDKTGIKEESGSLSSTLWTPHTPGLGSATRVQQ